MAAAAVLVLPAGAAGHEPRSRLNPDSRSFERIVGKEVRPAKEGLFEVHVPGPNVYTHGPDYPEDVVESHGTGMEPGDPERAPSCVTPGSTDYAQYVLYAYQGTENNLTDRKAEILSAVRRMNAVLNEEALESGGVTADYKVLCDAGEIRVTPFQVTGTSFSDHVTSARQAGFTNLKRDYTIFSEVQASTACGVGSLYGDSRALATNANNNENAAGVTSGYGVTFDGCWSGQTPMHENGHNQGAVQSGAPPAGPPHGTGTGGHCWDEIDVMCYSPDGGTIHQQGTVENCSDRVHFDCGHDDYFDPLTEASEPYLDDHWNIGASYNRFIVFGTPGTNSLPNASFDVSCKGKTCNFTDQSSDPDSGDSVVARQWDFGDGSESSEQNPSHTYAAPGSYVVTLTVTDENSATNQTTRTVVVDDPNPGTRVLSNGVPASGTVGEPDTWRDFAILVPRNQQKLVVILDGPACDYSPPCVSDMDLYVRKGALPELNLWRCRPFEADSDERCVITSPGRGWWYASVYNYEGPSGAPFRITARYR